ncbi:testis-specific protein TEX28 [Pipistrellus kuhlii]|uniref:Testis expressed 28 n=1 Tax=Pipistrellus kuhlii TaxID=59472 RepID=A0A7J7S4Z6_PIPKU|nr:testis-specific protein TEX28 [Pipistrellus kuhlii]KAF6283439.1 testis expressed 28 [Pipistrellus kuhlii]
MQEEYTKSPRAIFPSNIPSCRSRSLSPSKEGFSGHSSLLHGEMARNLQKSIKHRTLYLLEQLRVEKASRDQNTESYLKLVSKADRRQALHIRQAFEKVNQRASATIAQIERRLRQCHQQLQELQRGCQPKSSVAKEESSPDNGRQPWEKAPFLESSKPGGKDDLATTSSGRPLPLDSQLPASQQERSPARLPESKANLLLQKVKEELKEAQKVHLGLQMSYQSLKEMYLTDLQMSLECLQEEKCRQSLMAELVNEHLQQHLDEIYCLKQSLSYAEEKMAYLSYEKAKEIWEVMETFQCRISKLETLQQVTQAKMTENLRQCPRKFVFRFLNLLLMLATIFLVFFSTGCAFPLTLLKSRLRMCTVIVLVGVGILAWQNWHAISAMDWQVWVASTWRLYSKDAKLLPDGP